MKVKLNNNIPVPQYGKEGDAGFDLYLDIESAIVLAPNEKVKVSLGISMEIPEGHFGMVVPRSSMSKRNLILANTMGIIDSGYRGNILAVITNIGESEDVISPLDRLFQMVIVPFKQVSFEVVDELTETPRGNTGFGSTGK